MQENVPRAVKLFMGRYKQYMVVRFPTNLNDSFYDEKTGRMVQYKEIVAPEEIREAKKWLKENGFEYSPSLMGWVKEVRDDE